MASRKPTRPSAKRRPSVNKPSPLLSEIKYLCLAALGVLIFLSVYTSGAAGVAGTFIRNFTVGLIGFGAYILPFAIVGLSAYALFSGDIRIPRPGIGSVCLLCWFIISWLHIFNVKESVYDPDVIKYLGSLYENGSLVNGGLFGGLLGNLIRSLIGGAGAYIVLTVGAIITLVLLTGRSFTKLLAGLIIRMRGYVENAREDIASREKDAPEPVPARTAHRRAAPVYEAEPVKVPVKKHTEPRKPSLFTIGGKTKDPDMTLLISEELAAAKPSRPVNPILTPRKDTSRKEAPLRFEPRREDGFHGESGKAHEYPGKSDKEHDYLGESEKEHDYPGESEKAYSHHDELGKAYVYPGESGKAYGYPAEPRDEGISGKYDKAAGSGELETAPFEMSSEDFIEAPGESFDGFPSFGPEPDEPKPEESTIQLKGLIAGAAPSEKPVFEPVSKPEAGKSSVLPSFPSDSSAYEHYEYPSIEILSKNEAIIPSASSRMQILDNSRILEETLKSFKIEAKVIEVSVGPTVTRYDLAPGPGVKVSAIVNLSNDLALSLAARGIRIEAPIPGKAAVGIEIPNKEPQPVFLREIIEDDSFTKFPSRLAFAVGKDIAGSPVVTDVARMPHLLIAGATGSGKSVCINTLIASLLYKSRPDEVKLLMVDPKVVELSVYNGIPHLLIPVVTDPKKASGALSWAVGEMEKRYGQFAEAGVRDLKGYNNWLAEEEESSPLPQIVIIIDELADLMMTCKGEVEESICRLAQKARAAGIHLIVATQRPSVDVITGLIKANIPSRLAFAVSSGTDSRTVLDMYGAEKLLGKGDMLFLPMGQNKPIRLQGGFISDKEVEELVDFLKQQVVEEPSVEMIEKVTAASSMGDGEVDEFFHDAVEFLLQKGKASTSMLQRQFRIGYNRASRLMEELETRGVVGPEDGVKPRKILITREEYITSYT